MILFALVLAVFGMMTAEERAFVTDWTVGVRGEILDADVAFAHWDYTIEIGGKWSHSPVRLGYALLHEAKHHKDMYACLPMGTFEAEQRAADRGRAFLQRYEPWWEVYGYEPGWYLKANHCQAMERFVIDIPWGFWP